MQGRTISQLQPHVSPMAGGSSQRQVGRRSVSFSNTTTANNYNSTSGLPVNNDSDSSGDDDEEEDDEDDDSILGDLRSSPSAATSNSGVGTSSRSSSSRSRRAVGGVLSRIASHSVTGKSFIIRSTPQLFDVNRGKSVHREYVAEVVTGLTSPMDPAERRRREHFFESDRSLIGGSSRRYSLSSRPSSTIGGTTSSSPQYRLRSKTNGKDTENSTSFDPTEKWAIARSVSAYVFWSFKANLMGVAATLTSIFFLLTAVFAVAIYLVGRVEPTCFYVGDYDFEESGFHFIDAYAISWTTFSTVGYGVAGPAVSKVRGCLLVDGFMAVEALFGVLYASFAGAILFGRMTRENSVATVLWSDPIVIRYGTGVAIECQNPPTPSSSTEDTNNTNNPNGDETEHSEHSAHSEHENEKGEKLWPCPILEFRLHNTFFDEECGEIADATVKLWSSTFADFAPETIVKAAKLPKSGIRRILAPSKRQSPSEKNSNILVQKDPLATNRRQNNNNNNNNNNDSGGGNVVRDLLSLGTQKGPVAGIADCMVNAHGIIANTLLPGAKTMTTTTTTNQPLEGTSARRNNNYNNINNNLPILPTITTDQAIERGRQSAFEEVAELLGSSQSKHFALAEDPNNKLVPQLIYSKLHIDTDCHPLFKRTWTIRHRLNEHSPLLSNEANRRIKANDGYWPDEWNDYESVRKHLKFNEIVATLSGTDNATANTVYSQKTYDFVDVNIGYRFATSLVVDPKTQALGVDNSLINDVLEQHGGGAEPFRNVIAGDVLERNIDDIELGNGNVTTNNNNSTRERRRDELEQKEE